MCLSVGSDEDRGHSGWVAQTLAVERFSPREAAEGPPTEPCPPRHGQAVCYSEELPLVTFEMKQRYTILSLNL